MEMKRLTIDKGFALLKIEQASPSKDCPFSEFLTSIICAEQNFHGIAGFSVKSNFSTTRKILPEKILTSQNSYTLHEMPYFEQKGRGENAKHQDRTELQQN
jgi:hypothetical protein